jgi:hypothetical protein
MWKWLKSKSVVDAAGEQSDKEYDRSAGDPLVPKIYFSASTIDVYPHHHKSEAELVAAAAVSLVKLIHKGEGNILSKADAELVDGVFILCICNVICAHMRLPVEPVVGVAAVNLFGKRGFDLLPDWIATYNEMITGGSSAPPAIFGSVRAWIEAPGSVSLGRIRDLYFVLVRQAGRS